MEHAQYLQDNRRGARRWQRMSVRDLLGGLGMVTPASSGQVHAALQEAFTKFDEDEGPEHGFYEWKERNTESSSKLKAAR